MAARLEVFNNLVNTYKEEIGKLDADISAARVSIQALRLQLEAEERRLADTEKVRRDTVEQVRGIKVVVHKMEDAEKAARRAYEDRKLDDEV